MAETENKHKREEIFSKTVRAGKRTYFFDVKATKSDEYYLTITESKRRFNNDQGKFFYEKHKVFLYKEDFEKFSKGLNDAVEFIQTGKIPEPDEETVEATADNSKISSHTNIEFEDLGNDEDKDESASEDSDDNEESKSAE